MTAPTKARDRKRTKSRTADAKPAVKPAAKSGRAKKPGEPTTRKTPQSTTSAAPRSTHPDVQIDADTLEFIDALDRYKKEHNKPFPSWSEVLFVLRALGYRKADG